MPKTVHFSAHSNQTGGRSDLKKDTGWQIVVSLFSIQFAINWSPLRFLKQAPSVVRPREARQALGELVTSRQKVLSESSAAGYSCLRRSQMVSTQAAPRQQTPSPLPARDNQSAKPSGS